MVHDQRAVPCATNIELEHVGLARERTVERRHDISIPVRLGAPVDDDELATEIPTRHHVGLHCSGATRLDVLKGQKSCDDSSFSSVVLARPARVCF